MLRSFGNGQDHESIESVEGPSGEDCGCEDEDADEEERKEEEEGEAIEPDRVVEEEVGELDAGPAEDDDDGEFPVPARKYTPAPAAIIKITATTTAEDRANALLANGDDGGPRLLSNGEPLRSE
jgi:hypothetical protein